MKKHPLGMGDFSPSDKNPEFIRKREQVEFERQARVARLKTEQTQLLEDLKEVGFSGKSIWDFVNSHETYPEAIPVFLEHVQRVPKYSETTLTGLIRALTVREAKGLFNKIALQMFREDIHEPKANGVRWCLANALTVVSEITDVDVMIELLRDRRHASARSPLPKALVRFVGRRPDIVEALDALRDDPESGVRFQVAKVLSLKAAERAREVLNKGAGSGTNGTALNGGSVA